MSIRFTLSLTPSTATVLLNTEPVPVESDIDTARLIRDIPLVELLISLTRWVSTHPTVRVLVSDEVRAISSQLANHRVLIDIRRTVK